jgi:hypothetical protein
LARVALDGNLNAFHRNIFALRIQEY